MKLVTPDSISDIRVYFTQFDRVTYSQVAWTPKDVDNIRHSLERKLKLLALVKGHIVIAASHLLESELAQELLIDHPRVFSEAVVVPALRFEFNSMEQFLDYKRDEGKESEFYEGSLRLEMARLIDANAAMAIQWNVSTTNEWFKQRLIQDLSDKCSLLHSCLNEAHATVPIGFISSVEACMNPSRQDLYFLARGTGDKLFWTVICEWIDFLYYLSGAQAVRSEGVLPQENLLDFSISDLAGGKTRLSELEIFYKIFVDLIKSVTGTHFPIDLLDALSVEDVLDLHNVAVNEQFTAKYNLIQTRTKQGLQIHDPERLVLLLSELEEYEHELKRDYWHTLERELVPLKRSVRLQHGADLLGVTASILIPYFDIPYSAKELLVSAMKFAGKEQAAEEIERKVEASLGAIKRLIITKDIEDRPVLLSFANTLRRRYAEKSGIDL